MRKTTYIAFLILSVFSCKVANTEDFQNKKQLQEEFAENLEFEIHFEWANPSQTKDLSSLSNTFAGSGFAINRYNITTTDAKFKMNGDEVDVYLPFFGERRMADTNNAHGAIEYKGKVEKLKVQLDKKQKNYTISFEAKRKTETFDISITLFQNLNVNVYVFSTHRTSMRYDGHAKELSKEEEE